MGANSYREKDGQEVIYNSFIEELMYCIGGDTNLIAGLAGCLIGCTDGIGVIPRVFINELEDGKTVLIMLKNHFPYCGAYDQK
ncbi:MAG: hypothetical protein UT63_C0011G0011 [Candidatus Gottesmanbacteria bacterium GW2011_GWC2_39_8]|uniref:ADP-ribosylglycohydrolase n=1 Tax=Candidatus Gottesmanbacteria bacterium GW2011_GWC2_39_8 TaxID=1618450 RepID=A0A0G0Q0F2_9BACT|nr:MAG: hypothetical protein UT63_C0011G0011 [Candidatus Gottesmanbacteria bacterium GW2011_GWC2_39_8]